MGVLKTDFSVRNTVDPTLGAQRALSGITDIMKMQEKYAADELDRKLAQDRLGIAQAAEGRAVSDWEAKQAKLQAVKDANLLQTNITSGQPRQEAFESAMNKGLKQFETKEQKEFGYDQQVADLEASIEDRFGGMNIAPELKAKVYNTEVEGIRNKYMALDDPKKAAERDKYFEQFGREYAAVSEAGEYDGLKYDIMDPGFENRYAKSLEAAGFTPVEAAQQAKAKVSTLSGPTATKAQTASYKSSVKAVEDKLKNKLDILAKSTKRTVKGGTGSTKDSGVSFKDMNIEKALKSKGFTDDFFSAGDDIQKVRDHLTKFVALNKAKGMTEGIAASALLAVAEGRAGTLAKFDPTVDFAVLEAKAAELMKADKTYKKSKGFNSKVYNTYGPSYYGNAIKAMQDADIQKGALSAEFSKIGDVRGTGLKEMESRYGLATPTQEVIDTVPTVPATPDVVTPKVSEKAIVPGTPEHAAIVEANRAIMNQDTIIKSTDSKESINKEIDEIGEPNTVTEYDRLDKLHQRKDGIELNERIKLAVNRGGLQKMTAENKKLWTDLGSAVTQGLINITELPKDIIKGYIAYNKQLRETLKTDRQKLQDQERFSTAHDIKYNINPIAPSR